MTPEDFSDAAPGQMVRATGLTGEHWAFLPAPLPPASLPWDQPLARTLSEADRALGELAGVGRHVANPDMLIQPFIRREAVLSSRIEGTRADLADVYAYEAGQKARPGIDDALEVFNYVRATRAGLDALAAGRPLGSALIRELHKVLLTGVRGEQDRPGEFRDCPVFMGSSGLDEARFVPPPVVHLRDVLDAFDHYVTTPHDYPPVVRLALLHYQFEAIHPFRDGNGRLGRLLITLLLVWWKLLPLPLLYLSAFFERNRRAYYDHLLAVSTRAAWRDWVMFVATGVAEEANDAATRAKRLQDLQAEWRRRVQDGTHVSLGLLKTVDQLFCQPVIDASEVQERFAVSHPTALNKAFKIKKKRSYMGKMPDAGDLISRLSLVQRAVRQLVIESRRHVDRHAVNRDTAADTIYQIDTLVEPVLDEFCREWARTTPLVLVAEGIEPDGQGREGVKVFPEGSREEDAEIRLIVDPIDGTRGLMYDKRSAWALAAVAPNRGPGTSLRDVEVAVMTELPTSKMGRADVLWAVKGQGAGGVRVDLENGAETPLALRPSQATGIDHGFAMVSDFFPGTKVLAGELMEYLVRHLIGPADVTKATVFEDQYISTGGQFYELIVGHDRFNADLRPAFYRMQGQPEGLCCHPYDCAALLIAEEAGVVITNERGRPLDGPLDVTTGLSWIGYANESLRCRIEPLVLSFLGDAWRACDKMPAIRRP